MSKLVQSTSKYTIHAKLNTKGVVEKSDVIGAIFGQTEGLLGKDMDLRELQKTGRIGRINVNIDTNNGRSKGEIDVPSSLGASETALIAATLETIERVGPCEADIKVDKVEDTRSSKRRYLVDRAKEILSDLFEEGLPESQEISEQIKKAVRSNEITKYKGLPAGPKIQNYDSIIICEGRADVINLLRNGIKNVIAVEGTSIPETIINFSKEKSTTLFIDGDRGGNLILEEFFEKSIDLDYIAVAPRNKEVEELTKKEIYKALREKITPDQFKENSEDEIEKLKKDEKRIFRNVLDELTGTRAAHFYSDDLKLVSKVPVREMFNEMKKLNGAKYLVFDGSIDQKLINFSFDRGLRCLVGMTLEEDTSDKDMKIFTKEDF